MSEESSNDAKNKNIKNSLIEQAGRSIHKARRALGNSKIYVIDANNLLGGEEKGTIHMIKKFISLSAGKEKDHAVSLRQNIINAKDMINKNNIERAIEYLDAAIINFEEIKKQKQ